LDYFIGEKMTEIFKQTWWDNNLENRLDDYLGWLGDRDVESRVFIRDNIKEMEIKSIADFGCGPCIEYRALTEDGYEFDYLGIDSCIHIKDIIEKYEIPFLQSPVEHTGLEDSSFELSYSRHVLEHLPTYKDALGEMIRVSNKYVAHIFFIKPSDTEKINYWEGENLYHNTYSKQDIEEYLNANAKVKSFEWLDINDDENVLIIEVE
jgi:ubiquinone/menaquinone biosynthesis C-methylase UbiE